MLGWLTTRNLMQRKASEIYGAVVAQARLPAFYGGGGVPDTMVGRYELIVLHMFLSMERLRTITPEPTDLLRLLVEHFVTDMDDCMREVGVSDLKVGGHVRRAAAGLYERIALYRAALEAEATDATTGDRRLEECFLAHGLLVQENAAAQAALVKYVQAAKVALDEQSDEDHLSGQFRFPEAPQLGGV